MGLLGFHPTAEGGVHRGSLIYPFIRAGERGTWTKVVSGTLALDLLLQTSADKLIISAWPAALKSSNSNWHSTQPRIKRCQHNINRDDL